MSDYSVVVGVANPDTVARLMHLGCILAREYEGRVTAVTDVHTQHPAEDAAGVDRMSQSNSLLDAAQAVASECGVPFEARISVGRGVAELLGEVARAQQARLIIVGYSDRDHPDGDDSDFERLIDEIADDAPCDLLVAKFRGAERFDRVLAPVSTRPNLEIRRGFLTALHSQKRATVEVVHFACNEHEAREMHADLEAWRDEAQVADWVTLRVEVHANPAEAIVAASGDYDAVVLGTAPLYEVRRRYFGAVPDFVARHGHATTFLLRPHDVHPDG